MRTWIRAAIGLWAVACGGWAGADDAQAPSPPPPALHSRAASSQRRAPDPLSAALRAALRPEYEAYEDAFYARPPDSMEGYVRAVVGWDPMGRAVRSHRESLGRGGDRRRDSDVLAMQVRIEEVAVKPGRVLVTVSKRVRGQYHQGASSRIARVEGYAVFRHLWMDTGDGWRLMTAKPIEGWIRLNGRAFTAIPRAFNPNNAFRMKDAVESVERPPL